MCQGTKKERKLEGMRGPLLVNKPGSCWSFRCKTQSGPSPPKKKINFDKRILAILRRRSKESHRWRKICKKEDTIQMCCWVGNLGCWVQSRKWYTGSCICSDTHSCIWEMVMRGGSYKVILPLGADDGFTHRLLLVYYFIFCKEIRALSQFSCSLAQSGFGESIWKGMYMCHPIVKCDKRVTWCR